MRCVPSSQTELRLRQVLREAENFDRLKAVAQVRCCASTWNALPASMLSTLLCVSVDARDPAFLAANVPDAQAHCPAIIEAHMISLQQYERLTSTS